MYAITDDNEIFGGKRVSYFAAKRRPYSPQLIVQSKFRDRLRKARGFTFSMPLSPSK